MNEDGKKLDWMYKGASGLVDREEYLLGRTVDKTLEQLNNEEKEKKLGIVPPKNHVEHECIPPSIRDYNRVVQAEQVDLSAKLQEDPLVAIKKHEEEARRQFLQNPVQLKKLQEALKAQEMKKKTRKKSDSDSDLDRKIVDKLRKLKRNPLVVGAVKKENKKYKESVLDTILMHKFNELKDRLTEDDMRDIMEGRISETTSSSEDEEKPKTSKCGKHKKKVERKYTSSESSSSSREIETIKRKSLHKRGKKTLVESSSSSDGSQEDTKTKYSSKGKGKNIIKKRRNNSSEEDTRKEKYSNANDRRNKTLSNKTNLRKNTAQGDKKYKSDGSSDEKYKKNKSAKYKSRRNSSSEDDRRKFDKKRCSSGEEDGKYRRKQKESKEKSGRYKSSERRKYSRSDAARNKEKDPKSSDKNCEEHSSQKYSKSDKYISNRRNKRVTSTGSESNSRTSHQTDTIKDSSKAISQTSGNDLDAMILQKLRSLRNLKPTVNSNTNIEVSNELSSDEKYSQKMYSHYDSDNDEPLYKKKNFGLVKADGTRIALERKRTDVKKVDCIKRMEPIKKQERKHGKKLTETEKEKLRLQMKKDAEKREIERSDNLRRYREENKEEEHKEFDRNFVHKELLKSTNDASVETRIKSKLNNIQRSSIYMNSNFSKRS